MAKEEVEEALTPIPGVQRAILDLGKYCLKIRR